MVQTSHPPALLLGTYFTALGCLRSLAAARIPCCCLTPQQSFVASSRFAAPPPSGRAPLNEPARLAEYLDRLPFERAVLVPCSDEWVHAVANLRPDLSERFLTSQPTSATLDLFLDKGLLEQFLDDNRVDRPRTIVLQSESDFPKAEDAIYKHAFLKPRHSRPFFEQYGIKAVSVTDRNEAVTLWQRQTSDGHAMLLQEYLPGGADSHYFIDGFIDRKGALCALLARQRMRMYPEDFGDSSYVVSIDSSVVTETVDRLTAFLKQLHYRGIFSAEFVRDPRDDRLKLIEVNTRAWAYIQFAWDCGVNIAEMVYRDALNDDIAPALSYRSKVALVVMPNDLSAGLSAVKSGRLSTAALMNQWLWAKSTLFSLRDPAPWVTRWVELLKQKVGRRVGRQQ